MAKASKVKRKKKLPVTQSAAQSSVPSAGSGAMIGDAISATNTGSYLNSISATEDAISNRSVTTNSAANPSVPSASSGASKGPKTVKSAAVKKGKSAGSGAQPKAAGSATADASTMGPVGSSSLMRPTQGPNDNIFDPRIGYGQAMDGESGEAAVQRILRERMQGQKKAKVKRK